MLLSLKNMELLKTPLENDRMAAHWSNTSPYAQIEIKLNFNYHVSTVIPMHEIPLDVYFVPSEEEFHNALPGMYYPFSFALPRMFC